MKRLRPFELARPASLAEAVALLDAQGGEARALAGGTDLLVDMKLGRAHPRLLVDLRGLAGLSGVERVARGLRLGVVTPVAAIAASPLLAGGSRRALVQAAAVLGPPPIRHLATVGGNLGRSSPASDLIPPLVVLGAQVVVAGPQGERRIPVEEVPVGPGVTSLGPGEILVAVLVPDAAPHTASAYLKLGKRGAGWDLALAGAAVSLTLAGDGTVAAVRLALSSVGPTVLRARQAEGVLQGRALDEAAVEAAGAAAVAEVRPISDLRATADYRRQVAGVLVRRALRQAHAAALAEDAGS